jgi:hypothetical protein
VSAVHNISTRYALVKRATKMLEDIDDYFEDAADFGLSVEEADPRGEMVAIRKGLIEMLENERRIKAGHSKRPHS